MFHIVPRIDFLLQFRQGSCWRSILTPKWFPSVYLAHQRTNLSAVFFSKPGKMWCFKNKTERWKMWSVFLFWFEHMGISLGFLLTLWGGIWTPNTQKTFSAGFRKTRGLVVFATSVLFRFNFAGSSTNTSFRDLLQGKGHLELWKTTSG